jgi:hypothetical protein
LFHQKRREEEKRREEKRREEKRRDETRREEKRGEIALNRDQHSKEQNLWMAAY